MPMCGACRKPKLGEEEEVEQFAPHLREAALELPRSYRRKALERFKSMAIDISNPSDQNTEEILAIFTTLKSTYQRKAEHVRATAERKRVAKWEGKRHDAYLAEVLTEMPVLPDGPPAGSQVDRL